VSFGKKAKAVVGRTLACLIQPIWHREAQRSSLITKELDRMP